MTADGVGMCSGSRDKDVLGLNLYYATLYIHVRLTISCEIVTRDLQ